MSIMSFRRDIRAAADSVAAAEAAVADRNNGIDMLCEREAAQIVEDWTGDRDPATEARIRRAIWRRA